MLVCWHFFSSVWVTAQYYGFVALPVFQTNNQFFCGFLVLFVSNELFFPTFWYISIYERGNVCILSKAALCGCFLLGGWVPAMLYQNALHRKSEGVQDLRIMTWMVILLDLSVLFLETVKGKLHLPSQMDITAPSCFLCVYTCKLSNVCNVKWAFVNAVHCFIKTVFLLIIVTCLYIYIFFVIYFVIVLIVI